MLSSPALPIPGSDTWDDRHWQRILDRIEHRQAGIGLRFSGPPLWLEITMRGPDSNEWSTADTGDVPDQSWDWQASEPSAEVTALITAGADDDRLLVAASRYTVANLILNTTHEVGEWLRFDGRRLFAAHGGSVLHADGTETRVGDGRQGNGSVELSFGFDEAVPAPETHPTPGGWEAVNRRAAAVAAAWRFTYLPGTSISYSRCGPEVTETIGSGTGPVSVWGCPWSSSVDSIEAPDEEFVAAVQRDVHRMLVLLEANRICDGFFVDGARPWWLRLTDGLQSRSTPSPSPDNRRPLTISVGLTTALDGR